MKARYFFVALVLTTGCSAILGLKDGKLSPGLEGDPCELQNSPSTPCQGGLGCFGYRCYALCPTDGPCPSGSRCMVADSATNGGGGLEGNPRVCVPFDLARCNQTSNSSGPVCSNGGIEQCWNGECRTSCQIPQSGQTGPTGTVGVTCHAGETCVAQNPGASQGFCYAPSELGDSGGNPSGNTGTDLFVFGGNIDGPIAVGNANVYFGKDAGLWSCAKTGCNAGSGGGGAMNVSMGTMTPRFITAYGGGRVAWAFGQGGPSGIQRCNEAGSSCQVVQGFPYGGTQVSGLQGLDQRLYWLDISGQNLQLNVFDETASDAGSPTVGGFPMMTVPNQPNIGYHAITPEQHVVQVAGQMYAVLVKQPARQGSAISNDPSLFNFQGAPLITHGANRVVWVVETAEKSQLEQCHLDTSPTHDFVCLPDMGTFHDYKPQNAKVTALGSNGTMIFWSEWANDTSTIRACAPDPGTQFTSAACGSKLLTAEGNLPGKVVSLVADVDGYVYYMLAYNSANQRNGVNFALRRVKGP